ncbi:MAG: DUF6658 family protein [Oscillatoria sp. PMC 1068.18]|nr:DUF6658 family protein [Oscillatoria sp. PMC 1076.18]MEC4991713.1 DUF6658 family protein [Oscillatoria sp. PMC 1068.18]
MKKAISWLKKIQLKQIVSAFLVGILFFFTTACSGANATPGATDTSTTPSEELKYRFPDEESPEPVVEGMNRNTDVDPRRDSASTSAKAKALVDNAKRNLKVTGDVGENIKRADVGEKAAEAAKNASEKVKSAAEDIAEGTKEGVKNLTQKAPKEVSNSAERTAKGSELTRKVTEAADDAADAVK